MCTLLTLCIIRCVGGYSLYVILYCNCWDYLLLHEDWGECSEDWVGAWRWGCGGGGKMELLAEKKNSAKKCSWGLKTQTKKPNKRPLGMTAPLSNNTLCMINSSMNTK